MKKILITVFGLVFLSATRLAVAGIDYTDYRQEESSHQHRGSENRDQEREREREREKNYRHQNREARDKTVRTIERVNSYPEKQIP